MPETGWRNAEFRMDCMLAKNWSESTLEFFNRTDQQEKLLVAKAPGFSDSSNSLQIVPRSAGHARAQRSSNVLGIGVSAAKVTTDFDERWDYFPGYFITKDDLVSTIYKELSGR